MVSWDSPRIRQPKAQKLKRPSPDDSIMRKSTRVRFPNGRGQQLAGILELPLHPRGFALFSPCFTCTKDLKAIVRISRRLADHGLAVLRFDFTGLGESAGDFSATNFQTNRQDIRAAAEFLGTSYQPPQLLIGHSLGGAAALATAPSLSSVRAIATIAAPSDTVHLAELLSGMNPAIDSDGEGNVTIGGLSHRITRQMLETLRQTDFGERLSSVRIPLIAFHSPADETLAWNHAERIFQRVRGPRTLVTVDGADHLLVAHPGDVLFVADMIDIWSRRYLTIQGVRPNGGIASPFDV